MIGPPRLPKSHQPDTAHCKLYLLCEIFLHHFSENWFSLSWTALMLITHLTFLEVFLFQGTGSKVLRCCMYVKDFFLFLFCLWVKRIPDSNTHPLVLPKNRNDFVVASSPFEAGNSYPQHVPKCLTVFTNSPGRVSKVHCTWVSTETFSQWQTKGLLIYCNQNKLHKLHFKWSLVGLVVSIPPFSKENYVLHFS